MFRKFFGYVSLLISLLSAGRSRPARTFKKIAASFPLPEKTIAVIEIYQETNMFSPVKTTLADFQARYLNYGDKIISDSIKSKLEVGGFLAAVKDFGAGKITVVPIIQAEAVAGGPIEKEVWARFKREALEGLRGINKLDGIFIRMHGSMGVEGLYDPEGDLLQAIRDEYGTSLPIGASCDMHGNMTEKKALATFIVGRKTNPHRDFFATGYSAGEILIRTVRGEIHPTMTVNKMRLLKGGGQTLDFLPPMDSIFNRMREMEKIPGVLSVSNFMVNPLLDEPEMGWSTVAVTDNDKALADKLADEIADLDWAVRDYPVTQKFYSPSEAVKATRDSRFERLTGTTMWCDMSDTVGAGGTGESTWILKALVEEGSDLVSYIPIGDSQAVKELWDTPLNQQVTLSVGGKLDKIYNQPYEFTGQVVFKGDCRDGNRNSDKAVVLKNKGVHLILTAFAPNTYYPEFYTSLGLNLWKADIVIAKNLFPFRYRFLKYNRKTFNVVSAGTTNWDVHQLKYNNISRPIYPLDQIDSWQWKKW